MIQLVGALSLHHKVMSLIPSQGRCLGCAFNLLLGSIREVSLLHLCFSLSFPLPLSLKTMKKCLWVKIGGKKRK